MVVEGERVGVSNMAQNLLGVASSFTFNSYQIITLIETLFADEDPFFVVFIGECSESSAATLLDPRRRVQRHLRSLLDPVSW